MVDKTMCYICNKSFSNNRAMTSHRRWHDLTKYKEFQKSFKSKMKGRSMNAGKEHPMYGKHKSEDIKEKISLANNGMNNGCWKGEKASYNSIHEWVRNHKPKSLVCEICHKNKKTELMNIDHKGKRNINDYIWACRKCHVNYDYKTNKRGGKHKDKMS